MTTVPKHIFALNEAAVAYALSAERILGNDTDFLKAHEALIPIFVAQLFQSLEISIKHVGIETGLFNKNEVRSRTMRNGHGITEIADLAKQRMGSRTLSPLISALTYGIDDTLVKHVVAKMVFGEEFENTRSIYATRALGYAEVVNGDFALIDGLRNWVEAVKAVSINLPNCVSILSQWKQAESNSQSFEIWLHSL